MVLTFDHGGMEDGQVRTEITKFSNEVLSDPDDFEAWDKLVNYAEALEGGPTRNSSPQAIAAYREVFDRLLEKFPLMFGYWKKYADREFLVAGVESAGMIYERGVAGISNSVDLWTAYCKFTSEVNHNAEQVQELFDRAADHVGMDFHSHPFWDMYLQFQDRNVNTPNVELHGVYAILVRVTQIPLYHYARYSQRLNEEAARLPTTALCSDETHRQWRSEIMADPIHRGKGAEDIDAEVRTRINQSRQETYQKVGGQVDSRWPFEKIIQRGYFHVTEVDAAEIENWEKYLEFEIQQGDYKRVVVLFERCLVPTAYYEQFWLMYAHFLLAQDKKTEELRSIYARASCFFCPIARPRIRLEWALFEEMAGRPAVANDLYAAVLDVLPSNLETIKALGYFKRRNDGPEAAIEVWMQQLALQTINASTRAAVVNELARFSSRANMPTEQEHGAEGRQLFQNNKHSLAGNIQFWISFLSYEIDQPPHTEQYSRVKAVFNEASNNDLLSSEAKRDLADIYKTYLLEGGPKDSTTEVINLIHHLDRRFMLTFPYSYSEEEQKMKYASYSYQEFRRPPLYFYGIVRV